MTTTTTTNRRNSLTLFPYSDTVIRYFTQEGYQYQCLIDWNWDKEEDKVEGSLWGRDCSTNQLIPFLFIYYNQTDHFVYTQCPD